MTGRPRLGAAPTNRAHRRAGTVPAHVGAGGPGTRLGWLVRDDVGVDGLHGAAPRRGREVIGVDLLGHGTAPKPHDPAAYADLTVRVLEALPEEPVDAIGFSLGAMTLLRLAARSPERFRKLVLAGIGRNVVEPDEAGTKKILAAL